MLPHHLLLFDYEYRTLGIPENPPNDCVHLGNFLLHVQLQHRVIVRLYESNNYPPRASPKSSLVVRVHLRVKFSQVAFESDSREIYPLKGVYPFARIILAVSHAIS